MSKISRLLPTLLMGLALCQTAGAGVGVDRVDRVVPNSPGVARASFAPQRVPGSADQRVLKTIKRWLQLYRKGRLAPGQILVGTKSLLERAKLSHLRRFEDGAGGHGRGPGRHGHRPRGSTAKSELRVLVDAARQIRTVESAKILLEVASVGIDRRTKYTVEMVPQTIRGIGERALVQIGRGAVRDYLVTAANGEPGGPGRLQLAMQIAALRVLSFGEEAVDVGLYQKFLEHRDVAMRLSVAECLGRVGEAICVEWLAAALEKEDAATVTIALVWAIRDIHRDDPSRIKTDHLRRAVIAVGAKLGSVTDRPVADALVDFLERYRYQDSVPVLISLLERLGQDGTLRRPERLGPALAKRVNDVLRAMTGAVIPADDPGQWREFWRTEASKIDVTKPAKRPSGEPSGGTVSEFFGIPIRGRRVVFVIDVSGSMAWRMPQGSGGTAAGGGSGTIVKLVKAKQELMKAVNGLQPQHEFNVILYANVKRTNKWRKGLVSAVPKHKKALAKRLRAEGARGGTNLFGGLKLGLQIKSLVYGSRYDSHVDEIFLLSDGCPTVGDVTDMEEILRLISETNRYSGVRINAIYLGSKSDQRQPGNRGRSEREGGEFMKKLAEQNGGSFVWPGVSDEGWRRRR